MPFAPAIVAAIISAATAATGFGLEASGALAPGAPHLPPTPSPVAPALSAPQIASLASPYAAQGQAQFGGALSPQALMQWIESIMRQQGGPEVTGGPNFQSGLQQVVNQTFGSSFQPGLTTTGITSV